MRWSAPIVEILWNRLQELAMVEGNNSLAPEDGAVFWGKIEDLGNGDFRASCGARLEEERSVVEELPAFRMFKTESECRIWIEQQAEHRGFSSYQLV